MTQNEYNEIACSILKNDWDEKSTIQTGKFNISQFQGTAFDSNYACYRVNWSEWATTNNVLLAQKNSYSMVVKITGSTEENILKMLWKNGFPVPKVGAVLRYNNGTVILFMEMLPGKELYSCLDDDAWIGTITTLSEIHSKFWEVQIDTNMNIPYSNVIAEKMQQAYSNTTHNRYWKEYMGIVFNRFEHIPQTLVHGDMFPTNILVFQGKSEFVDWANAGIAPYVMDIGRLTAIIDKKTFLPMCPCSKKVFHAYFEKMSHLLKMEYDEYIKDIFMAQFIELAYFYSTPGFWGHKEEYNQKIEKRLHEIVEFHFK